MLEQLSDQKADLEVQQQTLNEQLASLEEQQTALSSKQDELSASIQAQDSTISKAQADQLAAQSEYEQVYAAYREAVDETNAWMSTHFDTDTPYKMCIRDSPLLFCTGLFCGLQSAFFLL